jgi:pimeloyl-ACP methyl ester carboxylesterase
MKRTRRPRRSSHSTNVRFPALRALTGLLVRLAPGLAVAFAERLFFTPPPPRRSRGLHALGEAEPVRVVVDGREVAAWRWGRGPAVALLHGWGGRAAQLTAFVPPLLARGFSVVALDAPGHGRSGRGLSSGVKFARALRATSDAVGGVHGVVAHSLGAVATAFAMREGLRVSRAVFLGAAADPPRWALDFAARLGLPAELVDAMRLRSEKRIGLPWQDLCIPALGRGAEAPLLVVHDRDDADVPFADAEAIVAAWPDATLVETKGLGHNGVLRDPGTIARAVEFLADGLTHCACGQPVAVGRECPTCQVQHELFDRELRWAASPAA